MDKVAALLALLSDEATPPAVVSDSGQSPPVEVGSAYFIRTVTFHLTGRVRSVHGPFVILEECAYIGDSGRYADCMKTGKPAEVEPIPDGSGVNWMSVTDWSPWPHKLPTEQV